MNTLSLSAAKKILSTLFGHTWLRTCSSLLLTVLIVANGIILIQSLSWPFILDASFLHYIAWLITQGAVPYRDIFDMNLPGTYIVHAVVIKLLGKSDFAFRIFDIGCLFLIALIACAFTKKSGRINACLAAGFFCAFHFYNGNLYCGQRDYVVLLFIMSALYFFVLYLEKDFNRFFLVIAGLLLGYGICIKPFCAFWVPAIAVIIFFYNSPGRSKKTFDLLLFGLSATVPAGVFLCWLAVIDGLHDFIEIYTQYIPQFYMKMRFAQRFSMLNVSFLGFPVVWMLIVVTGSSVFSALEQKKTDIRGILLLLGVVFGLISYIAQDKDNFYHLYPVIFFVFLLGLYSIGPYRRPGAVFQMLLIIVMLYIGSGLSYYSIKHALASEWKFVWYPDYMTSLDNDLHGRIEPPDMIQRFEYEMPGTKILLKRGIRQPTRYLSDTFLFFEIDHPVTQKIRREFLTDLLENPPVLLVVSKNGWPLDGYERLETFPELFDWISKQYILDIERPWYRIYKRLQ